MHLNQRRLCINLAGVPFVLEYDSTISGPIQRLTAGFSTPENTRNLYHCILEQVSAGRQVTASSTIADPMIFLDIENLIITSDQTLLRIRSNSVEVVSAALALLYCILLSKTSGLLLHASGLVVAGKAYVFLAPSGGGKSTVIENSKKGTILHDDKIAARKTSKGWYAGGVPLLTNNGTTGTPLFAPLAGLFLIKKSKRTALKRVVASKLVPKLAMQIYEPTVRLEIRRAVMGILLELMTELPVYSLYYKKGDDVSEFIS